LLLREDWSGLRTRCRFAVGGLMRCAKFLLLLVIDIIVIVLPVLAGVGSVIADLTAETGEITVICESGEEVMVAVEVMRAKRSDVSSRTSTRSEREARTPLP
jgi:hypothetical protein